MHWLPCFSFVMRGNRVMHLASAARGAVLCARFPAIIMRLKARLRRIGAQAVISDFDPFLAWAGRLLGLPVLQLNHPGIVQRHLSLRPRDLAAILCTRLMEGPFHERIWTSFYGGDVGPILRPELAAGSPRVGSYLLVNLAPHLRGLVLPELERRGLEYRLFPGGAGSCDQALLGCRAVISTAGHQTAAEALALGKPLLAIPQHGQYEQALNARMLKRSGGGMACRIQDFTEALPSFLRRLDSLRHSGGVGFRAKDCRAEALKRIGAFLRRRVQERSSFSTEIKSMMAMACRRDLAP
jgi:hypothetical protein